MSLCALCRNEYPAETSQCPRDGRRLVSREAYEASGRDAMLGATLAGRFTLLGRIGSGGMGTVYRAEQSPMRREIALKVLRRELGRDPETVARFKREARTLSQLKHPNTVTLFDFGQTDDGLLYLAMELLEGEMLSTRMRREGPLGQELATKIAMGVLRSLDEAHAAGIIHRDLKPDNIFLARVHGRPDEDEVVKVVDFGIAKIRDGDKAEGIDPLATQEGTVFGTPRYMSPEQAQGKSLDGRSDLYAVGVLLFHMITGNAPFTEDDAVVVMAHHIKTVPPPLREAAPLVAVSDSLEALVARALAKDPAERPQSAAAFLSRLDEIVPEFKTPALGVMTSNPRVSQAAPLRRTWWPAAVAAGLVFGVLTLAMARLANRARPPAPTAAASAPAPTVSAPAPQPPALAAPAAVHPEVIAAAAPTVIETRDPPPMALVTAPERAAPSATPAARHHRHHRHRRRHADVGLSGAPSSAAQPETPPASRDPGTAQPYHRWND